MTYLKYVIRAVLGWAKHATEAVWGVVSEDTKCYSRLLHGEVMYGGGEEIDCVWEAFRNMALYNSVRGVLKDDDNILHILSWQSCVKLQAL